MNKPFSNYLNKKNTIIILCCVSLSFILFSIILLSKNFLYLLITATAVLYLLLVYIGFEILYTKLNLQKTKNAFLCLLINMLILTFYKISILIMIYKYMFNPTYDPIYLEDISIFAKYRYFFMVVICILGIPFIILCKYSTKFKAILNYASYPSIKEETFKIIDLKYNALLDPLCNKLYDSIIHSKSKLLIFYYVNFFIFFVPRIIMLCYFVNFVFFCGNLMSLRYFIPISFFLWILQVFAFYFEQFGKGNLNYIEMLLTVNMKFVDNFTDKNYLLAETCYFTLKPYAFQEGYSEKDLINLSDSWLLSYKLQQKLYNYKKFLTIINMVLFSIYFVSWLYIIFVHRNSFEFFTLGLIPMGTSNFFKNLIESTTRMEFTRHYSCNRPIKSFWLRNRITKDVEQLSDGAIKQGHAVYGIVSDDGFFFHILGSITHGPSDRKNPSYHLDDKGLAAGADGPTCVIPLKVKLIVPIDHVMLYVVKGSDNFLESRLDALKKIHANVVGAIIED